tara:strand:- start:1655 stop:2530 length:876 start_codon:yes stop_codon:yes gene_type:complete
METLKIKNKNCEVEVLNNNLKSLNVTKNDIEYKLIAFDPNNYVISFIMAPWVNRIEDGKFECEKGVFNLLDNHPLGRNFNHAIHGTMLFAEWDLINHEENYIELSSSVLKPWPFKSQIKSRFKLLENKLRQELTIINHDNYVMPYSLGWHPWFNRSLGSEDLVIKFDSDFKWEIKNEIPTSKKIISDEISKFKKGYAPGIDTLDDCYKLKSNSKVILKWPEINLNINSSKECRHLTVYTPPPGINENYICVEPQTSTINSFQLENKKIEENGTLFLIPSESKTIFTEWEWW